MTVDNNFFPLLHVYALVKNLFCHRFYFRCEIYVHDRLVIRS